MMRPISAAVAAYGVMNAVGCGLYTRRPVDKHPSGWCYGSQDRRIRQNRASTSMEQENIEVLTSGYGDEILKTKR
jgi:hypothetical protein